MTPPFITPFTRHSHYAADAGLRRHICFITPIYYTHTPSRHTEPSRFTYPHEADASDAAAARHADSRRREMRQPPSDEMSAERHFDDAERQPSAERRRRRR